jgi:hypothetical protein
LRPPSRAQNLDASNVRIPLHQALSIAISKPKADFPDLQNYILYAVHPRALKGDREGLKVGALFWEILCKERAFAHLQGASRPRLHAGRIHQVLEPK